MSRPPLTKVASIDRPGPASVPLSTLRICIRSSVVVSLAVVAALALAIAVHAATYSSQAEMNLRALECLTETTERFIVANRRWPSSPADLREIRYDTLFLQWPADEKQVFERASMDFGCDLTQVARTRSDTFPFIRSGGPRYPDAEAYRIEQVIRAAQFALASDDKAETAPRP